MGMQLYVRLLRLPTIVSVSGIIVAIIMILVMANRMDGSWAGSVPIAAVPVGIAAALFCLYFNYSKNDIRFWQATRITTAFLGVHWLVLALVVKDAYPEGVLATMSTADMLMAEAPLSLSIIFGISLACSGVYAVVRRMK